jgi:hypothetical protein
MVQKTPKSVETTPMTFRMRLRRLTNKSTLLLKDARAVVVVSVKEVAVDATTMEVIVKEAVVASIKGKETTIQEVNSILTVFNMSIIFSFLHLQDDRESNSGNIKNFF